MLLKQHAWNDRRVALALSIVCLAGFLLAGCGSSGSSAAKTTPTPTTRSAAAVPAGFTIYKNADFSLSYPTKWVKQNPANGTGVQYQGPTNQIFVVASLGKLQNTPETFDAAFCSLAGFGGTSAGAPKKVTINGETWTQQQCSDPKGSKSAVVESTVYDTQFYYMAYGSPSASFQTNRSQYFNTMEQSFTFLA
ncbi:MAG TPA: hypothetical protein VH599_19715 [Ktedonobacterales bacterium]